jgi:hypothetical protein
MKTIDVIKHAEDRSSLKVSSSLLKWEPSSCSLMIKYKGAWYPHVSIFDGVIVRYNIGYLNRRIERDSLDAFLLRESKARLQLTLAPCITPNFVTRNPSCTDMLSVVSGNLSPSIDRDLYWQWAFQYMLVFYCHIVRSAAADLDSKLNAIVTSTAYSQLSQNLNSLFDSVSQSNVLNYSQEVNTLIANLDKIRSSVSQASYGLGAAYSDTDYRKYSRPTISAKRICLDDSTDGNWEVAPTALIPITIDNPAKLIECWSDLVNVLASIGISEPKPYGLTFCQDNLAALASLKDVAKLDYEEPQKWRETVTGTAVYESTPVSAMEFA